MVLMACNWCLALLRRGLSCRVALLAAFQRVTGLCVPLWLVLSPLEEWTAAWVRHSSSEDAKPPTAVRHYSLKAGSVDRVNQLHDGRFMLETSVQANIHTQSIHRGASVLLNDLFMSTVHICDMSFIFRLINNALLETFSHMCHH